MGAIPLQVRTSITLQLGRRHWHLALVDKVRAVITTERILVLDVIGSIWVFEHGVNSTVGGVQIWGMGDYVLLLLCGNL